MTLLRSPPDDHGARAKLRRACHTLKGRGRRLRAVVLGELAWAVENLLNRVLERIVEPSAAVRQLLDDTVQLLPALVSEFADSRQRQRDDEIGRASCRERVCQYV